MKTIPDHHHNTEEVYHEGELLAHTLNEIHSQLRLTEEKFDRVETPTTNDPQNVIQNAYLLQKVNELTVTVDSLVKFSGILANRAGLEVIVNNNQTIIRERN